MNMPGTGPVTHEIRARRQGRRTIADGGNRVTSINLPRSAVLRRLRWALGIACGVWLPCLDVQAIQPAGYHGIKAPLRARFNCRPGYVPNLLIGLLKIMAAFSSKENAGKRNRCF
jgi:hypothetical protein